MKICQDLIRKYCPGISPELIIGGSDEGLPVSGGEAVTTGEFLLSAQEQSGATTDNREREPGEDDDEVVYGDEDFKIEADHPDGEPF